MSAGLLSLCRGRAQLDPLARTLHIDGVPARLGGRAFDLLLTLVRHHPHMVSKPVLMEQVWPGLVVEEGNLHVHVFALRRLLGTEVIVTVQGRGYRFAGGVDAEPGAAPPGRRAAGPAFDGPPALIGRDALLAQLDARLAEAGCRLLTLTGAGGAGKTRLALELAARMAPHRPVQVVPLAAVRDPAELTPALAAALGLAETDATATEGGVRDSLRRPGLLLVLDNLEHLPGAAPWVARLLREAPGLQVLATSRTRLDLRQERVLTVPPLPLPARASADAIRDSPAVALLASWASHQGRPLADGDEDWHAAAEICGRLDGLPLAIELVAPRLRVMTPAELASRLQRRLDLATGGAADAPPHHRSLRQALDWSHDLLTPPARQLFRRLGVFVGGWSLPAAEAMGADLAGAGAHAADTEAWRALEELLQHHLVQREPDVDGAPRFAMLETIREYALEALVAAGEQARCEQWRAGWIAQWLASLQRRFDRGPRLQALAGYQAERGNVHGALRWAFDRSGDAHLQARLLTALVEAWYYDDDGESGEAWLSQLDHGALPGPLQARVLLVGANLANQRCCFELAADRAQRAAATAGAEADGRTQALAWCQQGKASGLPEVGLALLARGLHQLERDGEPGEVALATWWLGKRLAQEGGRDDEAERVLLLAQDRLQDLGDRWTAGVTQIQRALLATRRGDRHRARQLLDPGETIAREHDDRVNLAAALHLRARWDLAEGRLDDALGREHRVLRLLLDANEFRLAVRHCRWLAHLHERQGAHERAVRLLAASAGRWGDEGVLSLSTVSVDDRSDWCRAAETLRQTVPPERHQRWWQESQPWSLQQALARSMSWCRQRA